MADPDNTEAGVVADLARAAENKADQVRIIVTGDGRELIVRPEDVSVDPVLEPDGLKRRLPRYVAQSVTLQSTESLAAYVNRFKTASTILLADLSANSIAALIDYHEAAAEGVDAQDQARHIAHKATLTLPFSEEWKVWTGIDGKLVGQLEFARFLEENGGDIEAPDGATVLEACRDLQAKRNVSFVKAVRTASDNEDFQYTSETSLEGGAIARGGIEVPAKFLLRIPVYFDGAYSGLGAFLRWRLEEGEGLKLGVQLHRREHVRQSVFKGIVERLGEATACPVLFGKLGS